MGMQNVMRVIAVLGTNLAHIMLCLTAPQARVCKRLPIGNFLSTTYSALDNHSCWKDPRDARMLPPIQTLQCRGAEKKKARGNEDTRAV